MKTYYSNFLFPVAVAACIAGTSLFSAHAEESALSEKISLVKNLTGVFGISNIQEEITNGLKKQGIPQEALDAILMAVKEQNLQQKLFQISAEKLTLNELQAMKSFYNSPEGKSITEKLPEIAEESQSTIETSMQSILPQVFQAIMQKKQETTDSVIAPDNKTE